jgi:hypothetical protein
MMPQRAVGCFVCACALCRYGLVLLKPKTTRLRTAWVTRLLLLLLLLALPAVVQAQFGFITNNGAITITRYTGPGGAVVIPSTTNGLPITCIGDLAFRSITSVISVTIGDNITSIGSGAFISCTRLSTITVDAANPCYSSLDGVLFNKTQTALIRHPEGRMGSYTIPNGVTSIGDSAFRGCNGTPNFTIPDSVTDIGVYAFSACTNLSSFTIPNSVTSIGDTAFYECFSLISVTIGNGVNRVGNYLFASCHRLTSVTVPNSVTNIGNWAFYNCTSLTNITMPNSVTSLGDHVFYYCPRLTGVYFEGNAPSIGSHVFDYDNNATVYYLLGTTGWSTSFGGRPTALWNLPPVADASATEAWVISANGVNAVTLLDGSRSYDPAGDTLQYFWYSSSFYPPTFLATGVVAATILPVGSNSIDLVVSDGLATSTDSVTVLVMTTGQAVERLIWLVNASAVRNPKPLTATLSAALASIERGNWGAAAHQQYAFENKVRAQVSDHALARQFIEVAQQVLDALQS